MTGIFIGVHVGLFFITLISQMVYAAHQEDGEQFANNIFEYAYPHHVKHINSYLEKDEPDFWGVIVYGVGCFYKYVSIIFHEIWHFSMTFFCMITTGFLYLINQSTFVVIPTGIFYISNELSDNSLNVGGRAAYVVFSTEGSKETFEKSNSAKLIAGAPFFFWLFFTVFFIVQALANIDFWSATMALNLLYVWYKKYITLSSDDLSKTWKWLASIPYNQK